MQTERLPEYGHDYQVAARVVVPNGAVQRLVQVANQGGQEEYGLRLGRYGCIGGERILVMLNPLRGARVSAAERFHVSQRVLCLVEGDVDEVPFVAMRE